MLLCDSYLPWHDNDSWYGVSLSYCIRTESTLPRHTRSSAKLDTNVGKRLAGYQAVNHATLVPLPDWVPRRVPRLAGYQYLAWYHATLDPVSHHEHYHVG